MKVLIKSTILLTKYWQQVLLLTVWAILLAGGFWKLFTYANTPGESAQTTRKWPVESLLPRGTSTSTLVIFAHPRCPCSEATVGELERLMPHIQGKVKSFVVFIKPKSKSLEWAREALWKKAQAIPGVQTLLDENGIEAARFGARTSGQTLLYDLKGNLVFRGGITPERGHMGDSEGRNAILQFIETGAITQSSTPVFGCSLRNPERATREGAK